MGRGGQMVSDLTLKSHDPSSNPAGVLSFYSINLFETNEIKRKEARESPLLKVDGDHSLGFELLQITDYWCRRRLLWQLPIQQYQSASKHYAKFPDPSSGY